MCIFSKLGQHSDLFTLSYYNFYTLFSKNNNTVVTELISPILNNAGMILLIAIFSVSYLFMLYKKEKIDNNRIIEIGLFCVIITTFFLPRMHERYAYMADVLSVIYVFIFGKKRVIIPILTQIVSISGYINSCYDIQIPLLYKTSAISNLLNVIIVSTMLYKGFNIKNNTILESRKETNNG